MITFLKETLYLLDSRPWQLAVLIAIFFGSSFLDLAGLALIGPYIVIVTDSGMLDGFLSGVIEGMGLSLGRASLALYLGAALIGTFFLKAIVSLWIYSVITNFTLRSQERLRTKLMKHYSSLPYIEYLDRSSAAYVQSVHELTGRYTGVISNMLEFVRNGVLALVILTFIAKTNPVALVIMVTVLIAGGIAYDRIVKGRLTRFGMMTTKYSTAMFQDVQHMFEGFKEVQVLGLNGYLQRSFASNARRLRRYGVRRALIINAPKVVFELAAVAIITVWINGMLFVLGEGIDKVLPMIGVIGLATLRLVPAAQGIINNVLSLRFLRDSVSRLYHDLHNHRSHSIGNGQPTEKRSESGEQSKEMFKSLSLRKLSFRYPGAAYDALQDITLEIKPGDLVGLIGPSGAGKSTLVDIFLGFLEPQNGEILYNGKPLSATLADWRRQVAYLPQQTFIMNDTLKHNVAPGVLDANIDNDRLNKALRRARLLEVVKDWPLGAETVLGERGARLSGGQRQRVVLARAFYFERNVFILDEATNSLDYKLEKEIVAELRHLKRMGTVIIISHRFSTVRYCDYIWRLDGGRIVEMGTPERVLQTGD